MVTSNKRSRSGRTAPGASSVVKTLRNCALSGGSGRAPSSSIRIPNVFIAGLSANCAYSGESTSGTSTAMSVRPNPRRVVNVSQSRSTVATSA